MDHADKANEDSALTTSALGHLEQTLAGLPAIPGLGFFARDCAVNKTLFNDYARELLALSASTKAVGFEHLIRLVCEQDRDVFVTRSQAALYQNGGYSELIYQSDAKSSRVRCLAESATVISRDEAGNPLLVVGALRDITAQHERERDLFFALDSAYGALEKLYQGAYAMAKTVREQFSRAAGAVPVPEAVTGSSPLFAKQQSAYDASQAMLDDILTITALDAEQFQLNNQVFSLHRLLTHIEQRLHARAKAKGILLLCEIDKTCPDRLSGDDARIDQLLTIITEHAIATADTGRVVLSAHLLDQSRRDDDVDIANMHFQVAYTGNVISDAEENALFELSEGNMKLPLASRLATAMGGLIDHRSAFSVGHVFEVDIPLAMHEGRAHLRVVERLTTDLVRKERSAREPIRALVVDDNQLNRLYLRFMLERLDAQVLLASDGDEALRLMSSALTPRVDIIFMDLMMPGLDGFETTRVLRQTANGAALPIIGVTAHVDDDLRAQTQAAGFDEILLKPAELPTLRHVFDTYLEVGSDVSGVV